MKKITFLLFAFLLSWQMSAQLYQVPTCSGGLSSNTYGPMNSVATANATNRTAVIYPSSQLVSIAGQTLNALYFKRITASGTMGGSPNFKLYLKETTATDFGAASIDWATEIATATLVYDSNPSTATGSSAGWKSFTLSTNFVYSGAQNLAVYMEYVNTAASTTIAWDYEYGSPCVNTGNNNTSKYVNNTTGTPGTSLSTSNYRRPQIAFDYVVSCPAPTGFNYANLTSTTVDLNWIAGGSESNWEYVIQPAASPVPTSGTTIGTNAVVAAPVSPNTAYTAYLRASCGPGDVSIWKTVSFTTPCNATNIPYLQDFESVTVPALPSCTLVINAGTGNLWTTASPNEAGFTTKVLKYGWNGSNAANTWFFTQGINLTAGTSYRIAYNYGNNSTSYIEKLKVAYGTTPSAAAMTNAIADHPTVNQNAQQLNQVDFVPAVSGVYYFGFQAYSVANQFNLYVDNINIDLTPACSAPIGLTANGLVYNAANISWNPVGTATGYEYVLDNVATNPAGSGTVTTGTSYNATSLTPSTTYYFHIRTNCGGTYSAWTTLMFTTPAIPPANNECTGAIALTVNADFSCAVVTPGTVLGATASAVDAAACFGSEDDDVWFSFVATQTSHRISLLNVAGSVTDMFHSLWTGADCNALTLVTGSCSDGDTSNPSGLVIGQTYYVRVNTYTATGGQNTTFNICIGTPPAPPANDDCSNAIAIAALPYANTQDATAATNNAGYISTCSVTSGMNDGVWYTVVGNGADITININNVVGWDPELAVYTGTCGTFTCVGSADLGGSGGNESYTISASVIGTTYYINIGYYSGSSNSPEGPFAISVSTNLSTDSFDSSSFKAYPNPVTNVLNLSYSSEIASVEVFNMLGQKVLVKELNVAQGQIDMSNLNSGNYLVKVTADGQTKTIKVIKQ